MLHPHKTVTHQRLPKFHQFPSEADRIVPGRRHWDAGKPNIYIYMPIDPHWAPHPFQSHFPHQKSYGIGLCMLGLYGTWYQMQKYIVYKGSTRLHLRLTSVLRSADFSLIQTLFFASEFKVQTQSCTTSRHKLADGAWSMTHAVL